MRHQSDPQPRGNGQAAEERLVGRALVAVILAASPLAAWANTGVGFLVQSAPYMIVALPAVILIEAPILARILRTPMRRGLVLSAIANLVSTAVGFVVANVFDFGVFAAMGWSGYPFERRYALMSLAPMFFLTWWVEAAVIRRREPEASARAAMATLVANVVSYVALAAIVWVWTPPVSYASTRGGLYEALNHMGIARIEVSEEFQKSGRFPAARDVRAETRYLRSLRIEADGRIVGTLAMPDVPEVDGKSISYEPRVEGGAIVEWRCRSDAPAKLVPPACR